MEEPFCPESEEVLAQWPNVCILSTPREPSRDYVIAKATEEQGY
jgi:hypothetical protein